MGEKWRYGIRIIYYISRYSHGHFSGSGVAGGGGGGKYSLTEATILLLSRKFQKPSVFEEMALTRILHENEGDLTFKCKIDFISPTEHLMQYFPEL